jgi:hypothetical protein
LPIARTASSRLPEIDSVSLVPRATSCAPRLSGSSATTGFAVAGAAFVAVAGAAFDPVAGAGWAVLPAAAAPVLGGVVGRLPQVLQRRYQHGPPRGILQQVDKLLSVGGARGPGGSVRRGRGDVASGVRPIGGRRRGVRRGHDDRTNQDANE